MKYSAIALGKWIDEMGGMQSVAKFLGVDRPAVRVWLRGGGAPRVKTIAAMITLSKGRLTFHTIARETTRNLPKGQRIC